MPTERTDDGGLTIEVIESRPRQFLRLDGDDMQELWVAMGGEALEAKVARLSRRVKALEDGEDEPGRTRERGDRG